MFNNDQNQSQMSGSTPQDPVKAQQAQLLDRLLKAASIFGTLAAIAGTIDSLQNPSENYWAVLLYWFSIAVVLVFTFWKKPSYTLKAWVFVGLLFIIGATDFLDEGLNGSSQALLVISVFAASALLRNRSGIIILGICVLTMLGFAIAYSTGLLIDPNDIRSAKISEWIPGIAVVALSGTLIISSLNHIIPRLISSLRESQSLMDDLHSHQTTLEQQIYERTQNLESQIQKLERTARITQEISTFKQLEPLLQKTTQLISEKFGYYHTGIFLLDEVRQNAVLRAANSMAGKRHMSNGYQIRIGDMSLVSDAVTKNEVRISQSVGATLSIGNADYPETTSEMTVPLRSEGKIIGAINIHSKDQAAFSREDEIILQLLTDQIALAIDNTILFQQTQENLASSQKSFAQASLHAWKQYLQRAGELKERYDPNNILPPNGQMTEVSQQALVSGDLAVGNENSPEGLAIPIKERGQIIGYIYAQKPQSSGKWSSEEIELAKTLGDQLEIALESARLYQDTQRLAEQERLVSDITSQMRQSLDIESVLKTAIKEIRAALDIPKVTVRVKPNLEIEEQESSLEPE